MTDPDPTQPVLVTGATGYVAGWLVKKLLDEGYTVHAAVRDPDNEVKRSHLDAAATGAPGSIRYFAADLLTDGAYDEAMQGCGVVFHTASPFTTSVTDPQRELVDPARNGTRNVLQSANRTDSVERVVVTSSCAAIYGDNLDCERKPGGVLTEDDWNTSSSLEHNPYQYSKTVAEREAWRIAEAQNRWQLVVVNPSLVLGPALNTNATSESFDIVKQLGDGTGRFGLPRLGVGAVDVRDLADVHYRAGFTPEAQGRHIASGTDTTLLEMARTLNTDYQKRYPLPKWEVPAWLATLAAPASGQTWRFARRNFGYLLKADNRKSRESLGARYRPLSETMNDMFAHMETAGAFR